VKWLELGPLFMHAFHGVQNLAAHDRAMEAGVTALPPLRALFAKDAPVYYIRVVPTKPFFGLNKKEKLSAL
jgi:hypothetical protein